jgi:peroxiredoxin
MAIIKRILVKLALSFFSIFLFQSCQNSSIEPQLGNYRAEMITKDGSVLPFRFELIKDSDQLIMKVDNDKETLIYDDIRYENDSIKIFMPPFDAVIIAKVGHGSLEGIYLKEESGTKTPFKAIISDAPKFESNETPNLDLNGQFRTVFRPEKPYPGLGIFSQKGNQVSGTFRKNSGDTRFLSGIVFKDSILLSTFDGAHPYLIKAAKLGDTIHGNLYYQSNSITKFWMIKDDNYQLENSKELTQLKDGFETISFNFKNTSGDYVSLNDEQFKNKVVVVQIMGTWCPNCLDETQFFLSYIKDNPSTDIAFVALSFEAARTEKKAMDRIQLMVDRFDIPYPVLLAQFGSVDTKIAQEKLPMLKEIRSYPTTIIIDKSGKVNSIHTGFNGPATGKAFEDFKLEFDEEIKSLVSN